MSLAVHGVRSYESRRRAAGALSALVLAGVVGCNAGPGTAAPPTLGVTAPPLAPPPEVAGRVPLPSCGSEVVLGSTGANLVARECFLQAYRDGGAAEFTSAATTIEGGWVTRIYRVLPPSQLVVFLDQTSDAQSSGGWVSLTCARLVLPDPTSPIGFEVADCEERAL